MYVRENQTRASKNTLFHSNKTTQTFILTILAVLTLIFVNILLAFIRNRSTRIPKDSRFNLLRWNARVENIWPSIAIFSQFIYFKYIGNITQTNLRINLLLLNNFNSTDVIPTSSKRKGPSNTD